MNSPFKSEIPELTHLTAEVLTSYLSNNLVRVQDIPELIQSIHTSLSGLGQAPVTVEQKLVPIVSVKKSITPDYLISLEDGRQYKSLKRHLSGRGLTPAEYRVKWDLPRDYPMVAPNYAKQRSDLARSLGLGRKPSAPAAVAEPEPVTAPAKRGRRKAVKAEEQSS